MVSTQTTLPAGVSAALYPFAPHTFVRRGLRMNYIDEGQGEPVVMVHGNPTWSFHFRALVKALRGRYRTVVPDHIGMGLSDKPQDEAYDYRLQSRVDDLEALIAHLGLDAGPPLTLVLHDWGGMIGMAYAARHPQRVARLVLMNTAAFHVPAGLTIPLSLQALRKTPLGPLAVLGLNAFARTAARVCTHRTKLSADVRAAYCAPYDSWQTRLATLRFVQDIPAEPSHPSYALVSETEAALPQFRDTPALLLWGMHDFVFTPAVLASWRARWPKAEVKAFDDCGHYLLEDAPDEVCARVTAFLAEHSLPPPSPLPSLPT